MSVPTVLICQNLIITRNGDNIVITDISEKRKPEVLTVEEFEKIINDR